MTTLQARNLSLGEVHHLLGIRKHYASSFIPLLSLEPLTEFERQELIQIRDDFDNYLTESQVSEGQVKLLTVAPLLRLAGFYRHPIKITLEEGIAEINLEDEETKITGRLDILAVNKNTKRINNEFFWILVIETKNSEIAPSAGLSQLLTYAFTSLVNQESVWGLATNGSLYQFAYLHSGNPPTYQLMPILNILELEPSIQILEVLKAICKI